MLHLSYVSEPLCHAALCAALKQASVHAVSLLPVDSPHPRASLRVASCNISVSTLPGGSCTYRTTDPRMKQLRTDICVPPRALEPRLSDFQSCRAVVMTRHRAALEAILGQVRKWHQHQSAQVYMGLHKS